MGSSIDSRIATEHLTAAPHFPLFEIHFNSVSKFHHGMPPILRNGPYELGRCVQSPSHRWSVSPHAKTSPDPQIDQRSEYLHLPDGCQRENPRDKTKGRFQPQLKSIDSSKLLPSPPRVASTALNSETGRSVGFLCPGSQDEGTK